MKRIMCVVLVFSIPFACLAKKQGVTGIKIIEQGIYEFKIIKPATDSRASGGNGHITNVPILVHQTNQVCAVIGNRFGFCMKIEGAPEGKKIDFVVVTVYPGKGLKDPARNVTSKRERGTVTRPIGALFYGGYAFEHEWELVPGEWKFEIWHDSKKHAEVKFMVTKDLNVHAPVKEKQEIIRKMKAIIIPEMDFRRADIHGVIDILQKISKSVEKNNRGINMILSPDIPVHTPAAVDPFDPFAADVVDSGEGQILITISARQISLYEALNIVCDMGGLQWSIGKSAIVIKPKEKKKIE
ncbi:DUF3859 domain-containing protein [Verrucomicrobiota bacterium]